VYSEKPLALDISEARQLTALASESGLHLASAPCSYLSNTAQTLAAAVRNDLCGPVRLVYAELDDGFISQAPYKKWISESGAVWPYEDEFRSGCTLEHAGYYLTWLVAMFGSIRSITAASAATVAKKLDPPCNTPDVSIGILFFEAGPIVRLTCSIVAPHNHRILMVGDRGNLEVDEAWNNNAPVRFRKRISLRRRLMDSPFSHKVRLAGTSRRQRVKRRGAATMDFFLGPSVMLDEIHGASPLRCTSELALHVTEATLILQNAGDKSGPHQMQTRCDKIPPMEWARFVR
jgi:predicted dehydrogenase